MTASKLKSLQKDIDCLVWETARESGFSLGPICDGVADESGYLSSKLKIVWVLKEPYDDYDETGRPWGGGFSIVKDCFMDRDENWFKSSNGEDLVRNKTWQRIAYVMYGYRNGLTCEEMGSVRGNRRMFDELMTTGWVNLCKMPAYKCSRDSLVKANYLRYWKSVVQKQIGILNPDVLIFGRTFDAYRSGLSECEELEYVDDGDKEGWVKHYKHGWCHLLETYHPGRKGAAYVDALVRMLNKIKYQ